MFRCPIGTFARMGSLRFSCGRRGRGGRWGESAHRKSSINDDARPSPSGSVEEQEFFEPVARPPGGEFGQPTCRKWIGSACVGRRGPSEAGPRAGVCRALCAKARRRARRRRRDRRGRRYSKLVSCSKDRPSRRAILGTADLICRQVIERLHCVQRTAGERPVRATNAFATQNVEQRDKAAHDCRDANSQSRHDQRRPVIESCEPSRSSVVFKRGVLRSIKDRAAINRFLKDHNGQLKLLRWSAEFRKKHCYL